MIIRPAVPADATAIAAIHVASWQAAYAGQLPEDFLRGLSVADRRQVWEQRLTAPRQRSRIFVVTAEGVVLGFAAAGPSHDDDATADTAQLHAIYLDPAHWRRGLGRLLHDHVIAALREEGYRLATLWVLGTNVSAREFYGRAGWTADHATQTETIGETGITLEEVRYRKALA